MKTIRLQLTGLMCEACIARTRKSLLAVPGVQSASVQQHSAEVEFAGADPSPLLAAVESAGYAATAVER